MSDWMLVTFVQSAFLTFNVTLYPRKLEMGIVVSSFSFWSTLVKISWTTLDFDPRSTFVEFNPFLWLRPGILSDFNIVMMTTSLEESKAMLLNGPALPPPPGVTSQFVDPPNLEQLTIGIFTTCIFLATVAVVLRMWTKLLIIRQTTLDDCISSCPVGSKYNDTDMSQTSFFWDGWETLPASLQVLKDSRSR